MKKLFTLIVTILTLTTAFAQQYGSISGVVTTGEGTPAAYVSVGIQGTSIGTMTNDKGQFRIGKLNPGTYTVVISAVNLSANQKEVTVKAGENTVENFVLNVSNSELQEVVINEKNNRIKIDNPSPSLRLEGPLLNIPQNIQVVSSTALKEQQIISMSDGLIRNVSGAVRIEHWGDMYTNISMRGSQIQAFRNGFNVVNSFWGPLTEDVSMVDHVEFVKGPAGFMLANGDPSGLYNVVTKKPTGQTKGEFSFTTGSFGLYRASVDLDGKLSKDGKLLYRLNLAGQNKNSFRPYEHNNRYTFAPVVSYQVDDKTKLTFEYTLQYANMSDVGSYYVFAPKSAGYAAYPRNFTLLQPGLPPTKINDHSIFINLQHQLSTNWKLTAQTAYFNYGQKGSSMWPNSVNDDGTLIRGVGIWDAKSEMTMAQAFLNGDVKTGEIGHRILAGVDLSDKNYFADWAQSHALDTQADPFNPFDPSYGTPANGFPVFDRTLNLEARAIAGGGTMDSRYSAVFAQDELSFMENKVRLTLAGRYTYITQSSWGDPSMTGKKFTPRVGLSVSVDPQTAVYGLFDQSFTPQNAGRIENGGEIKPVTNSNLEFGIKRDWFGGKLNTTLAAYQITKNNEATASPNSTPNNPLSIILGQKKSKGIEFDVRGELAPGFTVTANYAITDYRVSKVGEGVSGINVGDIVPGYAKHVVNGWLRYKLQGGALKGTGVSGGFTGLFNRETDTWSDSPDLRLPAYYKFDAGLFWEGSKIKLNANVFNVFNKYLYSGSYYSWLNAYYWQAEAPRNYRLSVTYSF